MPGVADKAARLSRVTTEAAAATAATAGPAVPKAEKARPARPGPMAGPVRRTPRQAARPGPLRPKMATAALVRAAPFTTAARPTLGQNRPLTSSVETAPSAAMLPVCSCRRRAAGTVRAAAKAATPATAVKEAVTARQAATAAREHPAAQPLSAGQQGPGHLPVWVVQASVGRSTATA